MGSYQIRDEFPVDTASGQSIIQSMIGPLYGKMNGTERDLVLYM